MTAISGSSSLHKNTQISRFDIFSPLKSNQNKMLYYVCINFFVEHLILLSPTKKQQQLYTHFNIYSLYIFITLTHLVNALL